MPPVQAPQAPDTASQWEARIMQPPEQQISGPPIDPNETDQQRESRRAVQQNISTVTHPDLGLHGTVSTTGPNAYKDFIPLPASMQTLTGGRLTPTSPPPAQTLPSTPTSTPTPTPAPAPPTPPFSGFDLAGARKEGYSDAEILDALAARRNFNLAGARNEGYSDQDILNALITPQWKDLTPAQQAAVATQRRGQQTTVPPPAPFAGVSGFLQHPMATIGSWLPSSETAAQSSGAMIGGALTPEFGGAGAFPGGLIGEGLYQLHQELTGSPNRPQTSNEAAWRYGWAGAPILGAQVGEQYIPQLAARTAQIGSVKEGLQQFFQRTPQSIMTESFGMSDPTFQSHIEGGLDELKQGASAMGRNIQTVEGGRKALGIQRNRINAMISQIVNPQRNMIVPGSYQALVDSQMAAIPTDIKPKAYDALVASIKETNGGKDLTIGQLNSMRSDLSATQSSFYGKDPSGQLTMDAGQRAVDIARGNTSRQLFYDSLDQHGLGGGQAARQLNGRIGDIIHTDDALFAAQNKSIAQQKSPAGEMYQAVKQYFRPSKRTVDQALSTAVGRWRGMPKPVSIGIEKPVSTLIGEQQDLMPTGAPLEEPLLAPPPGTSRDIGKSIYQVQQRAGQAARAAPPPTVAGQQLPVQGFPGPLGQIQGLGPKGTYLTPEQEYLQNLSQRGLWQAGAPTPPPPGQMEMFPGGPPTLFPPMEQGVPSPLPPEAQRSLLFPKGGIPQTGGAPQTGQQRLGFPLKTPREIWLERRLAERFPGAVPPPKAPPK